MRSGAIAGRWTRIADRWSWLVMALLLAAAALVARVLIIRNYPSGGGDLAYYYHYTDEVLRGLNPYRIDPGVWSNYPLDIPPPEMGFFAVLVAIYHSPLALRVTFALADVITVLLVLLAFPRSRGWRLAVATFYAFNPFVLSSWVVYAEDKTVLFLAIVTILLFLERQRMVLTWVAATVLAAAKWISVFFLAPLTLFTYGKRGLRFTISALMLFGGSLIVAQLPYLPESLAIYARRNGRMGAMPQHASITKLLAGAHLYHPVMVKVFIVASVIMIFALFVMRQIDIRDVVVLSVYCFFVALPDESFDRLVLITVPFLFVLRLTVWRMLIVWGLTYVAALTVLSSDLLVPGWLPFGHSLDGFIGAYGSRHYVALLNPLVLLMPGYFIIDHLRRAATVDRRFTYAWPATTAPPRLVEAGSAAR